MDFSPQQVAALEAVRRWLAQRDQPVFRLFGYAGTGKTTLAIHLAREAMSQGQVLFGAFTGKAALVMKSKGCDRATTLHRMIYRSRFKSVEALARLQRELVAEKDPQRAARLQALIRDEDRNLRRPSFSLNLESEVKRARLVVVDEVSMVGDRMGEDLVSFGTPVLVLGDPAQLPPIGGGGYFTEAQPDALLTEVHRQAEGSPVVALATIARQGGRLRPGRFGESVVLPKGEVRASTLASHDQVICGRNSTRRRINGMLRKLRGISSPIPTPGEKLVCLRNDHDAGLLNGGTWTVEACVATGEDTVALSLSGNDTTIECESHTHHFSAREIPHERRMRAQEFDFGYALTCHKSQGSQWGSVAIVDESDCFREDRSRWLYTAITRAAERVTVVAG